MHELLLSSMKFLTANISMVAILAIGNLFEPKNKKDLKIIFTHSRKTNTSYFFLFCQFQAFNSAIINILLLIFLSKTFRHCRKLLVLFF